MFRQVLALLVVVMAATIGGCSSDRAEVLPGGGVGIEPPPSGTCNKPLPACPCSKPGETFGCQKWITSGGTTACFLGTMRCTDAKVWSECVLDPDAGPIDAGPMDASGDAH